jgi:DNA replication protein DnaC
MSAKTTQTKTDQLDAAVQDLRFRLSGSALGELIASFPKTQQTNLRRLVLQLADIERREREACNLQRRTREACFPKFTPLDEFDWNHPRAIDRGVYNALLELEFVRNAENALLRGPSGVGKSTLAANLGWTAIQAGYRVRFASLAGALADLLRQESLPAFERRKRRYSVPDLLILDELGYIPCDSRSADILYAIIASRHEKAATVITTNLPFKKWPEVFPGAACVGALVDRFVQHCHVIDIDADSWRRKVAEQRRKTITKRSRKPAPAHKKKAKTRVKR